MAIEDTEKLPKATLSEKFWKITALLSLLVTIIVMVMAVMMYTGRNAKDLFWPEERVVKSARAALLRIERESSLVTTKAYVQVVVRQSSEEWYGDAEVIRIVPATISYAINLKDIDQGRMEFDEQRQLLRVPLPDVKIVAIDPDLGRAEIIRRLDFLRSEGATGNELEEATEKMIRPKIEEAGKSPEIIKIAKEQAIASVRQLIESALGAVGQPVAGQPYFKNDSPQPVG